NNRFDDPKREYRTLYCAETVSTCLREVLADFRPNAESITEFEELFGEDSSAEEPFGLVPAEWQEKHVIAEAAIVTDRKFATIEAAATLKILGEANASLLKELGHVKATP